MNKTVLNIKELEKMEPNEKNKYYESLKKELSQDKKKIKNNTLIKKVIGGIAPFIRSYDLVIEDENNIPKDTNAVFVMNHSNAHDFFTMQEVMKKLGINQSFLAANEALSPVILKVFEDCGAVLFNRLDKEDATNAFTTFTSNLINGNNGVIFAESTWNLHPYKPMHLIKVGASYSAAIAEIPIVPVIFEYIESNECCKKEKDIFTKCVVRFGNPINISRSDSLIEQTNTVQKAMEQLRIKIWEDYSIEKTNFDEEKIDVYLNHTYLKKFGGAADYDSNRENKYLLVKDEHKCSAENDYHRDKNGLFVPGTLTKEEGENYMER